MFPSGGVLMISVHLLFFKKSFSLVYVQLSAKQIGLPLITVIHWVCCQLAAMLTHEK